MSLSEDKLNGAKSEEEKKFKMDKKSFKKKRQGEQTSKLSSNDPSSHP